MTEKRRGRPKGSKTQNVPRVYVVAPRCPSCNSSERGSYFGTPQTLEVSGEIDGQAYNRVVWRRARCKCGQTRIEKTFELI